MGGTVTWSFVILLVAGSGLHFESAHCASVGVHSASSSAASASSSSSSLSTTTSSSGNGLCPCLQGQDKDAEGGMTHSCNKKVLTLLESTGKALSKVSDVLRNPAPTSNPNVATATINLGGGAIPSMHHHSLYGGSMPLQQPYYYVIPNQQQPSPFGQPQNYPSNQGSDSKSSTQYFVQHTNGAIQPLEEFVNRKNTNAGPLPSPSSSAKSSASSSASSSSSSFSSTQGASNDIKVVMPDNKAISYNDYLQVVKTIDENHPVQAVLPNGELREVNSQEEIKNLAEEQPSAIVLLKSGFGIPASSYRDIASNYQRNQLQLALPNGELKPLITSSSSSSSATSSASSQSSGSSNFPKRNGNAPQRFGKPSDESPHDESSDFRRQSKSERHEDANTSKSSSYATSEKHSRNGDFVKSEADAKADASSKNQRYDNQSKKTSTRPDGSVQEISRDENQDKKETNADSSSSSKKVKESHEDGKVTKNTSSRTSSSSSSSKTEKKSTKTVKTTRPSSGENNQPNNGRETEHDDQKGTSSNNEDSQRTHRRNNEDNSSNSEDNQTSKNSSKSEDVNDQKDASTSDKSQNGSTSSSKFSHFITKNGEVVKNDDATGELSKPRKDFKFGVTKTGEVVDFEKTSKSGKPTDESELTKAKPASGPQEDEDTPTNGHKSGQTVKFEYVITKKGDVVKVSDQPAKEVQSTNLSQQSEIQFGITKDGNVVRLTSETTDGNQKSPENTNENDNEKKPNNDGQQGTRPNSLNNSKKFKYYATRSGQIVKVQQKNEETNQESPAQPKNGRQPDNKPSTNPSSVDQSTNIAYYVTKTGQVVQVPQQNGDSNNQQQQPNNGGQPDNNNPSTNPSSVDQSTNIAYYVTKTGQLVKVPQRTNDNNNNQQQQTKNGGRPDNNKPSTNPSFADQSTNIAYYVTKTGQLVKVPKQNGDSNNQQQQTKNGGQPDNNNQSTNPSSVDQSTNIAYYVTKTGQLVQVQVPQQTDDNNNQLQQPKNGGQPDNNNPSTYPSSVEQSTNVLYYMTSSGQIVQLPQEKNGKTPQQPNWNGNNDGPKNGKENPIHPSSTDRSSEFSYYFTTDGKIVKIPSSVGESKRPTGVDSSSSFNNQPQASSGNPANNEGLVPVVLTDGNGNRINAFLISGKVSSRQPQNLAKSYGSESGEFTVISDTEGKSFLVPKSSLYQQGSRSQANNGFSVESEYVIVTGTDGLPKLLRKNSDENGVRSELRSFSSSSYSSGVTSGASDCGQARTKVTYESIVAPDGGVITVPLRTIYNADGSFTTQVTYNPTKSGNALCTKQSERPTSARAQSNRYASSAVTCKRNFHSPSDTCSC